MKNVVKLCLTTAVVASSLSIAIPAASAASIDAGLYPATSGDIYIDPVSAKVLAATPASEVAGVGADLAYSTLGPSTTYGILLLAEKNLKDNVRDAAASPRGAVEIHWYIDGKGGVGTVTRNFNL